MSEEKQKWCPDVVLTDRVREHQMIAADNNFGLEQFEETVAVIVLSYNRPRMLKEALQSLVGADQIIIADDGSDFEPMDIVKELGLKNVSVLSAPKAPLEVRTGQPRLGKMINHAINHLVDTTLITYLCDDDLLHKDWLVTVKNWMYDRPGCHVVKGKCSYFNDGESLDDSKIVWLGGRNMTSGNFVHRTECAVQEGIKWPENKLTSIDDGFLWDMYKHHNTWMIPFIDKIALYRRVHENALSAFSYGYELTIEGEKILKARVGDNLSSDGKERLNKKIWME